MNETNVKRDDQWLHAVSTVASMMMGIVLVVGLTLPACFKYAKTEKPVIVAAVQAPVSAAER